MARPKKGEKPPGFITKCAYCGIDVYRPPSRAIIKKTYCCAEHLQKNAFHFSCLICNKIVYTQPAQIKYRNRKTCSMSCRSKYARKMAVERRIENGYTKHQLDRLARYSKEAKEWREKVFARDNWTCQICGTRGGVRLEADHIKPFAYFPKLRYEVLNGRTLCRKCHDKTKMDFRKMRKIYAEAKC